MYAECWTCGNSLLTCHFVSVSPALYTRSQSNPWFAGLFTNLFLQQLWRVLPFIGLISGRAPKRELGAWLSKDGVWFSCFVCLWMDAPGRRRWRNNMWLIIHQSFTLYLSRPRPLGLSPSLLTWWLPLEWLSLFIPWQILLSLSHPLPCLPQLPKSERRRVSGGERVPRVPDEQGASQCLPA